MKMQDAQIVRLDEGEDSGIALVWSTKEYYAELHLYEDGMVLCNARKRGDKPTIWESPLAFDLERIKQIVGIQDE